MAGIVEKIKGFLFSPSESCNPSLGHSKYSKEGYLPSRLLGLGSLRKEHSEMLPQWCRGGGVLLRCPCEGKKGLNGRSSLPHKGRIPNKESLVPISCLWRWRG